MQKTMTDIKCRGKRQSEIKKNKKVLGHLE